MLEVETEPTIPTPLLQLYLSNLRILPLKH